MSLGSTIIIAAIAGGACAIGLSEYVIRKRRARHAVLVKRYNNLPKRPDNWVDDVDWDDAD